MSPEQQRIAIEKACGWKYKKGYTYCPDGTSRTTAGPDYPNYLSDLNACHEMEKRLDRPNLRVNYYNNLSLSWTGRADRGIPYWWLIHEATPTQRCEAFLRTLNLWIESSTTQLPNYSRQIEVIQSSGTVTLL